MCIRFIIILYFIKQFLEHSSMKELFGISSVLQPTDTINKTMVFTIFNRVHDMDIIVACKYV